MAVRVQNPFEASFENLSSGAAMGAKKVKKATGQAVQAVVNDAKQQITGIEPSPKPQGPSPNLVQQLGLAPMPEQKKEDVDKKQKEVLAQTRQNLEQINQQIQRVREEKAKAQAQKQQTEKQEKQEKKAAEEKKKADPLWKRLLKGNQGAHEGNKHVSG